MAEKRDRGRAMNSDISNKLSNYSLYQELQSRSTESEEASRVRNLVNGAVEYAVNRSKTVVRYMTGYTLHDETHLFRVLEIMGLLLGKDNVKNLSTPELELLLLAAFFHDLGMSPDEKEIVSWRKFWDEDPQISEAEEASFRKFSVYVKTHSGHLDRIRVAVREKRMTETDKLKDDLVVRYIRETHASRARQIIQEDWMHKIRFGDTDLSVPLATICFSHTEDPMELLRLDDALLCGQDVFASLPIVGVILRLADILDFDSKRAPDALFSNLDISNPTSFIEWQKHRSVEAWHISESVIKLQARCKHPSIEYAIRNYCDSVDHELSDCGNVLTSLNELLALKGRKLKVKLPFRMDRSGIEAEKDLYGKPSYIFRNTAFTLSKNQIVDLLMGTKLYGRPEVALRELVQNSIDTCLLRASLQKSWNDKYDPKIAIRLYAGDHGRVLEVEDNGMGMDQLIIDNYYTKVGTSFYTSENFQLLKAEERVDFEPTSRFGIGILSVFMVADEFSVETKHLTGPSCSGESLSVTVRGHNTVFLIKEGERSHPGTKTKLFLRSGNPWEKMASKDFFNSVNSLIPNPPFEITIECDGSEESRDQNSFLKEKAITLKDHSWDPVDNVKIVDIEFNDPNLAISGTAVIAILETKGTPVREVNFRSRNIEIDGNSYEVSKSLEVSNGRIEKHSTSIEVDEDGNVETGSNWSYYMESRGRISLHGIEVPMVLFPKWWEKKQGQANLSWPLPMLLMVDISGQRDLRLNTSRDLIINDRDWLKFEEDLTWLICREIKRKFKPEYWNELKATLVENSKSKAFSIGLARLDPS